MLPNHGIWFLLAIISAQTRTLASSNENVPNLSSSVQLIDQNGDSNPRLADRDNQIVLAASTGKTEDPDVPIIDVVQSPLDEDADVMPSNFVCPYELKSGEHYGHGPSSLSAIYKILTACSETRVLHLTVRQGGCVVTDDPWHFEIRTGDRLPPLEELRLDGYDLDGRKATVRRQRQKADARGWRWYRNFVADVTGMDSILQIGRIEERDPASIPTNLDLWRGAMDWTKLQYLEIIHPPLLFVEDMAGQLPSLKSLKLGPVYIECGKDLVADTTTEFIMKSPKLEKLSLHGYTALLDWNKITFRHGETLQELTITQYESCDPFNPRPTFSASKIQDLKASCPNLAKLGLDINRNCTWPYPILDALATFPKLRALDLFFELGEDLHIDEEHSRYWDPFEEEDNSAFRLPRVSTSSALHLFRHLRSRKAGVELERLAVHAGDWGRNRYSSGMRTRGWGDRRRERFLCDVMDEKGDRKLEGEAWCTSE
ncbi:hypothetical protein MMC07_004110 [Pseudocyphellaria aurata]|nr:hypothetical protein [Pseudocyphellaria aurata]